MFSESSRHSPSSLSVQAQFYSMGNAVSSPKPPTDTRKRARQKGRRTRKWPRAVGRGEISTMSEAG